MINGEVIDFSFDSRQQKTAFVDENIETTKIYPIVLNHGRFVAES